MKIQLVIPFRQINKTLNVFCESQDALADLFPPR